MVAIHYVEMWDDNTARYDLETFVLVWPSTSWIVLWLWDFCDMKDRPRLKIHQSRPKQVDLAKDAGKKIGRRGGMR
jgi:hypothetical protein